MTLRLGVIGLSEGNGHPYSWAAIFNGYDKEAMENCGFPVIPRYLKKQEWPEIQVKGAEVNAVWSQDPKISKHIAKAARIPNVCRRLEDLHSLCDAILLARDDAEHHIEHAITFLDAGMPVYIDKPVALSLEALEKLYKHERYPGQIFTCSALSYSNDLQLTPADREKIGEIRQITAFTPKSWAKYSMHIIEPVLGYLNSDDSPTSFQVSKRRKPDDGARSLIVNWSSGVQTSFHATGKASSPLSLRLHGTESWTDLTFQNSFSAFRSALLDFVEGIAAGDTRSPKSHNQRTVQLVEAGMQ
ncbi:Gfo/Idh/MocA family oxidoreductase [Salicola sp. Rm-C-2C1-2]|uniref:Gfo/Idh/MocA family oxidoreductase n=1 Tax=Salicola sp. Rm-C-2C1-2 TaxID=3141321 RepID=UPI0032E3A4FD